MKESDYTLVTELAMLRVIYSLLGDIVEMSESKRRIIAAGIRSEIEQREQRLEEMEDE